MFGKVGCCLKVDDVNFEDMPIDNSKVSEDFVLLRFSTYKNS